MDEERFAFSIIRDQCGGCIMMLIRLMYDIIYIATGECSIRCHDVVLQPPLFSSPECSVHPEEVRYQNHGQPAFWDFDPS
jgi:hypothetical protein